MLTRKVITLEKVREENVLLVEDAPFSLPLTIYTFTTPSQRNKRKALAAFVGDDSDLKTVPTSTGEDLAAEVGSSIKKFCKDPRASPSLSSRGRSEEPASPPQPAGAELSKSVVTPSTAGTCTGTGTASMDSEDDFMSDASSQEDFLDMHGSDDESLGEGENTLPFGEVPVERHES